jgi:hypothetical protein
MRKFQQSVSTPGGRMKLFKLHHLLLLHQTEGQMTNLRRQWQHNIAIIAIIIIIIINTAFEAGIPHHCVDLLEVCNTLMLHVCVPR